MASGNGRRALLWRFSALDQSWTKIVAGNPDATGIEADEFLVCLENVDLGGPEVLVALRFELVHYLV